LLEDVPTTDEIIPRKEV